MGSPWTSSRSGRSSFRSPDLVSGGPTVLTAQQAEYDEDGTPVSTCRIADASDVPQF